jgi:molecular chaperone GrpE
MEAIAIVPPPDGEPSGTILNVVEKGYMIHDRVLRPAKVIVSE